MDPDVVVRVKREGEADIKAIKVKMAQGSEASDLIVHLYSHVAFSPPPGSIDCLLLNGQVHEFKVCLTLAKEADNSSNIVSGAVYAIRLRPVVANSTFSGDVQNDAALSVWRKDVQEFHNHPHHKVFIDQTLSWTERFSQWLLDLLTPTV